MKRFDNRTVIVTAVHLLPAILLGAAACTSAPAQTPPAMDRAAAAPEAKAAVSAQWVRRAPLPERRFEVNATTDGRYLYLAGGFGPPAGGQLRTAPRTLWRYDPQADRWSRLTEIPQGVNHAPFQYHDGRLYILGGFREHNFEPVGHVRIYDLATGRWSEGAPMPTPRGATGWTVLNARIHVIGGQTTGPDAVRGQPGARITGDIGSVNVHTVNVHEAYDPATDSWTRLAPMPTPRNHLGAAALDGRIHAVLGRSGDNFIMTTHEVYDPATDSWSAGPSVPTGRSGVAVLALGGRVYAFGGEVPPIGSATERTFDDAERFDPRANRWERLPPMPTGRHGVGAAAVDGSIYLVSGGPTAGISSSDVNERLDVRE